MTPTSATDADGWARWLERQVEAVLGYGVSTGLVVGTTMLGDTARESVDGTARVFRAYAIWGERSIGYSAPTAREAAWVVYLACIEAVRRSRE